MNNNNNNTINAAEVLPCTATPANAMSAPLPQSIKVSWKNKSFSLSVLLDHANCPMTRIATGDKKLIVLHKRPN